MPFSQNDQPMSLYDTLFIMVIGVLMMFFWAFININVTKIKKTVEAKAEFIIIITWSDKNPDDVDTYIEDPLGNIVFYNALQSGLMHLERDDVGNKNDRLQTPFGVIEFTTNREVSTIRGIIPGEYVINVHMYAKRRPEPTEVTIQLDKINPFSTVVLKKKILIKTGDEKTAFRFKIDKDGNIQDVTDLPKAIATKGQAQGGPGEGEGEGYEGYEEYEESDESEGEE